LRQSLCQLSLLFALAAAHAETTKAMALYARALTTSPGQSRTEQDRESWKNA
jgi:hypothetical protein